MSDTTTIDLRTTGQLCADLQVSHHRIATAIDRAGIKPALRLNGIAHYDEAAVDAIRAEIATATSRRGDKLSHGRGGGGGEFLPESVKVLPEGGAARA